MVILRNAQVGTELGHKTFNVRYTPLAIDGQGPMIHTDEYAKQKGFRGAFVGGNFSLAFINKLLLETLGQNWLEQGAINVRFRKPTFNGDALTASAVVREKAVDGATSLVLDVKATNQLGEDVTLGEARFPAPSAPAMSGSIKRNGPLLQLPGFGAPPATTEQYLALPLLTLDKIHAGQDLGGAEQLFTPEDVNAALRTRGEVPVTRPDGLTEVDPGQIGVALRLLGLRYRYPDIVWAEQAEHYGGTLLTGRKYRTYARIADCGNRRGRDFAVLESWTLDEQGHEVGWRRMTLLLSVERKAQTQ